jgi:D-glycero-alpha-D-manno-heptose 1-phosphate guanylyltransferase
MPTTAKDVTVIILCGGIGSRLGALVADTPKPLLPVQGRPFMDYLIRFYERQGIEHFILCTSYLGEQFRERYTSRVFSFSHEEVALGTGGAVVQALSLLKTRFYLVINGDSFVFFDLSKLIDFHEKHHASLSMVLYAQEECSRFGKVSLDDQGRVVSFIEKQENAGAGLINAGVYFSDLRLAPPFAPSLSSLSGQLSMEMDILPGLIGKGLCGFVASGGEFIDIGTPSSFSDSAFFRFD